MAKVMITSTQTSGLSSKVRNSYLIVAMKDRGIIDFKYFSYWLLLVVSSRDRRTVYQTRDLGPRGNNF
jgi:hypothetical protein